MKIQKRIRQTEQGFSMVEMILVVAIIAILTLFTVMSLSAPKKYRAENQALTLIDFMREAQQRALSQKDTMRVEINSDERAISLINENEEGDAGDDTVIKTLDFIGENVYVGVVPTNMTSVPSEMLPVLPVVFSSSLHPHSLADDVATMRFTSSGTVLNAGTSAAGAGATPTGATIYVWTKRDADASEDPTEADILRAVTVLGSSGSTKLWKCAVPGDECTTWTR